MRYFIEFSYDGSHYHGWQYQPNAITVQQVLEDRMSKLLKTKISLVAAGRTDAGVHAKQMYAHADFSVENLNDFIFKLNNFLPPDIAIQQILPVTFDAHARFDAIKRTYEYCITTHKAPFSRHYSWFFLHPLSVNKMNTAAEVLLDYTDFTSFARLHSDNKTNLCKIHYAKWFQQGNTLRFTITADRFLRNMVRAIVGTLVEVGQGRIDLDRFKKIIEQKDRKLASASAPAQGLFLSKIEYPSQIFKLQE